MPFGPIPVAAVVGVGVGALDPIGEPGADVPAEQGHDGDQQTALRVVGGLEGSDQPAQRIGGLIVGLVVVLVLGGRAPGRSASG